MHQARAKHRLATRELEDAQREWDALIAPAPPQWKSLIK